MNPVLLDLLPFARQGYCCSQLLALLLLRGLGEENPMLVRAMHGLCQGMGGNEGPCGLITGGACVLGCLAGRGTDAEQAHPSFVPLVSDYQQWFTERTGKYGGTACFQVMQGLSDEQGVARPSSAGGAGEWPGPAICGDLFADCWEKILSLLEAYDIPMESR